MGVQGVHPKDNDEIHDNRSYLIEIIFIFCHFHNGYRLMYKPVLIIKKKEKLKHTIYQIKTSEIHH
jgi:hypothetical protein